MSFSHQTPRTAGNERMLLWTGHKRPVPANFRCQASAAPTTALAPAQTHAFNQVTCTAESAQSAPICLHARHGSCAAAATPVRPGLPLTCARLSAAAAGTLAHAMARTCTMTHRHAPARRRPRRACGGRAPAPPPPHALATCVAPPAARAPTPRGLARARARARAGAGGAPGGGRGPPPPPPPPRRPPRARARARVTRRTGRVCARCRRAPCSGCPRLAGCCRR